MDEKVTISKREYNSLLIDSRLLEALRDAGVDNWEGYSEACREVYGDEDEDLTAEDDS